MRLFARLWGFVKRLWRREVPEPERKPRVIWHVESCKGKSDRVTVMVDYPDKPGLIVSGYTPDMVISGVNGAP